MSFNNSMLHVNTPDNAKHRVGGGTKFNNSFTRSTAGSSTNVSPSTQISPNFASPSFSQIQETSTLPFSSLPRSSAFSLTPISTNSPQYFSPSQPLSSNRENSQNPYSEGKTQRKQENNLHKDAFNSAFNAIIGTSLPSQQQIGAVWTNPANKILQQQTVVQNEQQQNTNLAKSLSSLYDKERSLESLRYQGFLENQQSEVIFADGQAYLYSKKLIIDIAITALAFAVAFTLYRCNSILIHSRISSFQEITAMASLLFSILSKVFSFTHQLDTSPLFFAWLLIGFSVDFLSLQYFFNQTTRTFLLDTIEADIRSPFSDYLSSSLSFVGSLMFYSQKQFVEKHSSSNVNRSISQILRYSLEEEWKSILTTIKLSFLSLLATWIGLFSSGNRLIDLLMLSKASVISTNNTFERLYLTYFFCMSQIILISLGTRIIINMKTSYIWNILGEMHDIHKVQNLYFIMAHRKIANPYLEMKALKFWQANYSNMQKVNIRKQIALESEHIEMWDILLRHGKSLSDRLDAFTIHKLSKLEALSKQSNLLSKQYRENLSTLQEGLFLIQMVSYSVQSLAKTYLAFRHCTEYQELFFKTQTLSVIGEIMTSVLQDLLTIKAVVPDNEIINLVFKQHMCEIAAIQSERGGINLFNGTVISLLSKSDTFYTKN